MTSEEQEEKTNIWCKCGHLKEEHEFSRIYDGPTKRFLRNETTCRGRDAVYNKAADKMMEDEELRNRISNGDILLEDIIGEPVCPCEDFVPLIKRGK